MKLKEYHDDAMQLIGYYFHCPGCGTRHAVSTTRPNSSGARWSFNGNLDKPTFSPSLNQRTGPWPDGARIHGRDVGGKIEICHLNVTDGICDFHADSTHEHAGQKLPLLDLLAEDLSL
jgi:hypothetical protein